MVKSEHDIFIEKILAVSQKPIRKNLSKLEGNGEHHWIEDYILFKRGANEKEYPLKLLQHYINTIRFRTFFAEVCLQRIREECDNKLINPEDFAEISKKQENDPVNVDFVIQVEYFLFALKSILDVMARLVRDIEGFNNIGGGRLHILEIRDHLPAGENFRNVIHSNADWIDELTDIRKTITHITVARFSSNLKIKPLDKTVEYNRRVLEITKDDLSQKKKKLPEEFDELFKRITNFSEHFYAYLNQFQLKGS